MQTNPVLSAIFEVVKRTTSLHPQKPEHGAQCPRGTSEYLVAITKLSTALAAHPREQRVEMNKRGQRQVLNSIKNTSLALAAAVEEVEKPTNISPSIFSAIDKTYGENLHSDVLAGLLNPVRCGKAAHSLFSGLLRHAGALVKFDAVEVISCHRELTLSSIDQSLNNSDIGERRIDILIEGRDHVLIIENKVLALESDHQTEDYFSAAMGPRSPYRKKEVIGLLLSPDGIPAKSKKFKSITFWQLYSLIQQAKVHLLPGSMASALNTFYLNELFHIFIETKVELAIETKRFWNEVKNE